MNARSVNADPMGSIAANDDLPSLYSVLTQIPADSAKAYDVGAGCRDALSGLGGRPEAVLIIGDRESGLGEMLAAALSPILSVPVVTSHAGNLPAFVGPRTLVIVHGSPSHDLACIEQAEQVLQRGAVPLVLSPRDAAYAVAAKKGFSCPRLSDLSTIHNAWTQIGFFAALGGIAAAFREPDPALVSAATDTLQLIARQRDAYAPEIAAEANPTRALAGALEAGDVVFISQSPLARAAAAQTVGRMKLMTDAVCREYVLPVNDATWPNRVVSGCGILLVEGDATPADQWDIEQARARVAGPLHELKMDGSSSIARLWSTLTLLDWAIFYVAP